MRTCENLECRKELKRKQNFFCSKRCKGKIRAIGNKNALGHQKSKEVKLLLSEQKKGNTYRAGAKISEEQKRKHSEFMRGKRKGEKSSLWQGGNRVNYSPGLTKELKKLIRERDSHKCQICEITTSVLGKTLDTHHIDYTDYNHAPSNLISVCRSCHNKTRRGKGFYINFFKNKEVICAQSSHLTKTR